MPDHVIAGLVALAALGVALAIVVRRWWTAPVVDAIEGLRADMDARAYADRVEAEDAARKAPRP